MNAKLFASVAVIAVALCALAGGVAYYLAVVCLSINKLWGSVICVAVTIGLRRWSLRFNVQTPADVDLAPRVQRVVRRVRVSRWRARRK